VFALTLAGTGVAGCSNDGLPGVDAAISEPFGLTVGPDGGLYFGDVGNHRICRLDLDSGVLTTIAGTGTPGCAGDGGDALGATFNEPYELRFDASGDLFVVDMPEHVIRRIDMQTRVVDTIAGTGEQGFAGDGGHPRLAQFSQPHSIEFGPDGKLYVADIGNHRVRAIDLTLQSIATVAGTGEPGDPPDGASLAGTPLNGPRAIAFDADGRMVLALREGNRVLRIDLRRGRISHLAGNGRFGYEGDGLAMEAKLAGPKGVTIGPGGDIFIADTESHTIRRIDADGAIVTILGTGVAHDGPDGDPLACGLARPHGVFATSNSLYVGDSDNHRIRHLKLNT
jgi:DNA-binding beta-propeller fold protein YncE